ncbi:UNVERIFIED_CONTAM: hypothetical protein O8I53_05880 [Campylobacter lari]
MNKMDDEFKQDRIKVLKFLNDVSNYIFNLLKKKFTLFKYLDTAYDVVSEIKNLNDPVFDKVHENYKIF